MITITRDQVKSFAPKAKPQYVDALMSNLDLLEGAGILESELRLCHFFGQVGAETDYLTIFRESMHYTTPKALRNAWPSRFGPKSDGELKHLLKNPVGLGEVVYGLQSGRKPEDLGNALPGDGFAFRGGGWFQTTGRGNVARYADKCGVECTQSLLDDPVITLRFACLEWQESGCNTWADENDITKVSKAINTGSATSKVKPVGMANRQKAFAKAWEIWGEGGVADKPAALEDVAETVKGVAVKYGPVVAAAGGGTATVATKATTESPKPEAKPKPTAKETIAKAQETKALVEQAKDLGTYGVQVGKWAMGDGMLVVGLLGVVVVALAFPKLREKLT